MSAHQDSNSNSNQNSDPDNSQPKVLKSRPFSKKSEPNKIVDAAKARLSLEGQLKQARISLQRYVNPKFLKKTISEDTLIPKWVLKKAKGIVFLTVIKAGFLFAGNLGTGCVIVRKPDGSWTGPSSVGVAGVSFGFLAGASKVDYIMILPNEAAVRQFTGVGQLRLGGELQVALGPMGRDANGSVGAGDKGVSVVYSYSHAQGLYGGVALDGKIIVVRNDSNHKFYDSKVSCKKILDGEVDCPRNEDYDMIIHLLDSYCLDEHMLMEPGQEIYQAENTDEGPKTLQHHLGSFGARIASGFESFKNSISQNSKKNDSESNSNSDQVDENINNGNNNYSPPARGKINVVDSDNLAADQN